MLDISDVDISFQFDNHKIKLIQIGYGVFLKPYPAHRHGNRFYEAHYVCGGKGTLIANGINYQLKEGILYMTGPQITHEQLTDSTDPMDEYCVQFEISESKRIKGSRLSELIKNTTFWIGEDKQDIRQLFDMLSIENENKAIGYTKSIINLLSQLLVAFARNYAGDEKNGDYAKATLDDRRMLITEGIFLRDYATITLPILSKHLNLSPRQTQRFLKKAYGKTFIEMRTEFRYSNARKLIESGMSTVDAAVNVGYADEKSLRSKEKQSASF